MLKGHTKIELKNEKTGEIQVVEKDNMVTNATSKLLEYNGLFSCPFKYSGFSRNDIIANDLFGGIFLWKNTLSSDTNDYLLPADNECTGYNYLNSSNTSNKNTLLGSYNKSESGLQSNNSYKHVFDFATNQANGEISAVSLVPYATGYMSCGIPEDKYDPDISISNLGMFGYAPVTQDTGNTLNLGIEIPFNTLPLFTKNNYLYCLDGDNITLYKNNNSSKFIMNNGKKLIIKKYEIQNKILNISHSPYSCKFIEDIEILLLDNIKESVLGDATYSSLFMYTNTWKNNLYIHFSGHSTAGQIIIINTTNWTCSSIIDINMSINTYISKIYFSDIDKYVLMSRTNDYYIIQNNKLFDMSMQQSTTDAVKLQYRLLTEPNVVHNIDNNIIQTHYSGLGSIGLQLSANFCIISITKQHILLLNTINNALYYVYDTSASNSNILHLGGLSNYNEYNHINLNRIYDLDNNIISYTRRAVGNWSISETMPAYQKSYNILTPIYNPFVLTTKNNLDTPVTKTSEQSMKITYTLTEES